MHGLSKRVRVESARSGLATNCGDVAMTTFATPMKRCRDAGAVGAEAPRFAEVLVVLVSSLRPEPVPASSKSRAARGELPKKSQYTVVSPVGAPRRPLDGDQAPS